MNGSDETYPSLCFQPRIRLQRRKIWIQRIPPTWSWDQLIGRRAVVALPLLLPLFPPPDPSFPPLPQQSRRPSVRTRPSGLRTLGSKSPWKLLEASEPLLSSSCGPPYCQHNKPSFMMDPAGKPLDLSCFSRAKPGSGMKPLHKCVAVSVPLLVFCYFGLKRSVFLFAGIVVQRRHVSAETQTDFILFKLSFQSSRSWKSDSETNLNFLALLAALLLVCWLLPRTFCRMDRFFFFSSSRASSSSTGLCWASGECYGNISISQGYVN